LDLESLKDMLKSTAELRQRLAKFGMRAAFLLGLSFVLASGVSDFMMSIMMESTMISYQKLARASSKGIASVDMISVNYRDIQKGIEDRNLFNMEGEFPDEVDPNRTETVDTSKSEDFDMNAECKNSNLPLELLGTIYLTRQEDSIATIKEKGFSAADMYKVGDAIIDNDEASIAAIFPRRVILNNRGVKECIELVIKTPNNESDGFPDMQPSTPTGGVVPPEESKNPVDTAGDTIILEEKYVQEQLGPGFGTIIQKARLVPNTDGANGMNGFKIFAIDKSSLIGKIGLQNGDIISRVNDTSLKEAEQGFRLYQALQDERDIMIYVERNGKPETINIQIK